MTMPVWIDKDAYSFVDKMKNYIGDQHSGVWHDWDEAGEGPYDEDFEVGLDVVFNYTEDMAYNSLMQLPRWKYQELSKKVYRKMYYAMAKYDSMALDDVDDGDGRGAIENVLGTAGTWEQQLQVMEANLEALVITSKADYIPFSKKFGRIRKEWQKLSEKTPAMGLEDKLGKGRQKRLFLQKIKDIFPGIWRDAKRAGNTDTLASMHRICMELARDAKSSTTPVSHMTTTATTATSGPPGGGGGGGGNDGGGNDGGGAGATTEKLLLKIAELEAKMDHSSKPGIVCHNCNKVGHVQRYCANKGGPFEHLGIAASVAAKQKYWDEKKSADGDKAGEDGKPAKNPTAMSNACIHDGEAEQANEPERKRIRRTFNF